MSSINHQVDKIVPLLNNVDNSFFLQMQDNLEKPLEESFLQNIDDNEDI
jgi:hypothetical protein